METNKPTLEEVKEYFKNAEIVKDIYDKRIFNISKGGNLSELVSWWYDLIEPQHGSDTVKLWSKSQGYAEIVKYKDTSQKIKELEEQLQLLRDKEKEEKKPELEVGRWYKDTRDNYKDVVCVQSIEKKHIKGFGFVWGTWKDETASFKSALTPATDSEVKQALIKEAKKRGFKEGVKCLFGTAKDDRELTTSEFYYVDGMLAVKYKESTYKMGDIIFKDGKWAEIIEDKKPVINGYTMEIVKEDGGNRVKFGCAGFLDKQLIRLYKAITDSGVCGFNTYELYSNRKVQSITLSSDVTITIDQLKEVVDYLDK